MAWQDWLLSVAGFLVFASLVPTVVGDDKPALSTSVLTGILSAVVGITMATLDLWLGAAANWAVAAAWIVIAAQTVRRS